MQLYYTNAYATALGFCTRSAQAGDSQSQYILGLMHLNGLGTPKNRHEAIKWLQASAQQSYAAARYKLDQLNSTPAPAPSNQAFRQLAEKMLQRSAPTTDSGNIATASDHAEATQPNSAPITPPDDRALFQQHRSAAQLGSVQDQFLLGLFYLEGRGVQKNEKKAGRWIKTAARNGLAEAQLSMGLLYYRGYNKSAPDVKKAAYWFAQAAEQGVAEAQYCMGQIRANGVDRKKNEAQAVRWWRKAALQKYAPAQHNLAVAYLYGAGVRSDRDKAMQWFIKEAEHGDPQTQFNLARLYSEGKWFNKNARHAANWFYRAGEVWLSMNQPEKARHAAEEIRHLASAQHLKVPNIFLADVLDRKIKERGQNQFGL